MAEQRFLDHHNIGMCCLQKGNEQGILPLHVYQHDQYGCINHSDNVGATIRGAGDSLSESITISGDGELRACQAASALMPFFSSLEESPVCTMGE